MTLTAAQREVLAHLRASWIGPDGGPTECVTNLPHRQYAVGMLFPADATARARFVARHPGRVAGLTVSLSAFRLLDPPLSIETVIPDGSDVLPGDTLAVVSGLARPILSAERTALNLLGRLCGIATATRGSAATSGHSASLFQAAECFRSNVE